MPFCKRCRNQFADLQQRFKRPKVCPACRVKIEQERLKNMKETVRKKWSK